MTEDLDRAIEEAVKEALERDRAERDELRRQREPEPAVASDEAAASDASEDSDDSGDDGRDTAGDAACPGGEATNPDR
ncbi:MAG TPA: hypothetical protein VIB48_13725 [Acidimicrobiia bacterium]|jgi:hypothetical protein